MKKPYTKNKKKTKNDEWEKSGLNFTMPVKSVRLKKESQLDRIERKLEELLSRSPVQILPPSPGTWTVPEPRNPVYEKAPWWMNPDVPPPTLTCNTEETK